MKTNMSRRTLVAGGLALAPAAAVAALPAIGDDPILALIEAHRAASQVYHDYGNSNGFENETSNGQFDEAKDALAYLLAEQPTTLSGAVAFLEYLASPTLMWDDETTLLDYTGLLVDDEIKDLRGETLIRLVAVLRGLAT
jgi:hypothetical protein